MSTATTHQTLAGRVSSWKARFGDVLKNADNLAVPDTHKDNGPLSPEDRQLLSSLTQSGNPLGAIITKLAGHVEMLEAKLAAEERSTSFRQRSFGSSKTVSELLAQANEKIQSLKLDGNFETVAERVSFQDRVGEINGAMLDLADHYPDETKRPAFLSQWLKEITPSFMQAVRGF
jgi:hypothetical protein